MNTRIIRVAEIIPGALIWGTIILSVVLSIIYPMAMIYFIILFDLYWLLRIIYNLPFLLISWRRYRRALRRDWQQDVKQLPGYDRIKHLIFLPTTKEDVSVVRETLKGLVNAAYPAKQMIVILAGEERFQESFDRIVAELKLEFENTFFAFWTTIHKSNIEGDISGKGSNLHWSAKKIVPRIIAMGFVPEDVIVSSFDVDSLVHQQYFSCLTYKYLTAQDPTHSSYQPVALYNNNLWESPAPVRIAMFGTTFWLMMELARPEGMITFSSHSMSLRMLIDVGFWQRDIVSEDSRIFLQGLATYHGRYRVTPIHLPVSMDTVMAGDYWKALIALYRQLRRWAWGVENFPYMIKTFMSDRQMSFWIKTWWILKQLEGSYTWATAPFLIFLIGYLPFWFAPESLRTLSLFQNTPFTLEWLMRLSMIGLFVSASLALTILPPRPQHMRKSYAYLVMILQWAFLPVTFVIFGAIPAIDAQTRLMLGKKLGFVISPKRLGETK